jgi:hypothetical protein
MPEKKYIELPGLLAGRKLRRSKSGWVVRDARRDCNRPIKTERDPAITCEEPGSGYLQVLQVFLCCVLVLVLVQRDQFDFCAVKRNERY